MKTIISFFGYALNSTLERKSFLGWYEDSHYIKLPSAFCRKFCGHHTYSGDFPVFRELLLEAANRQYDKDKEVFITSNILSELDLEFLKQVNHHIPVTVLYMTDDQYCKENHELLLSLLSCDFTHVHTGI